MYEIIYSMKNGGRVLDRIKDFSKAKKRLLDLKHRGDREGAIYKMPFHSTTDRKALVLWFGEQSYWDNVSKEDQSVLDKKI